MRWWFGKPADERETDQLIAEVRRLRANSHFQSHDDAREYITDLLVDVCSETELCPSALIAAPLATISHQLLIAEPFCFDLCSIPEHQESLESASALRVRLRRAKKILAHESYYLGLWREKLAIILRGIVAELPVNVLVDPYPDGTIAHQTVLSPETPLCEFIDDFPYLMQRLVGTFFDRDVQDTELFHDANQQFLGRLCVASGIEWNARDTTDKNLILPQDQRNLTDLELSELYTDQTVFADLFALPVPVPVPNEVRFEHMLVTGGTGHGKTQLLQYLIYDDLIRAADEKISVVVIDPDGTLIKTLSQSRVFADSSLGERTIFIDPTDSELPVGLNLFDVSHMDGADTRTRETVENNTIELFEYFFDALLGSELTSRQSTLFRYLGLLLMQIPGGNIHTLRELMEDGEKYRPYMEKMSGTARTFFVTRFFDKSLNATKQQILARLWGVLSNRSLDRLFSAKHNTVKFDHAMQDGKIIFVNTSKEYLGEEGSAIFARMIVALIGQGLIRRAGINPQDRTPSYIYIDEAEGVIDQTMVRLLAQVRKHRGAITLAHQHLEQISAAARAGVLANTSIKLAGGVSAKDAQSLAAEFRVDKGMILSQRKSESRTQFALFAKNITPAAMSFHVPLGFVESIERLLPVEYEQLIERSRQTYGVAVEDAIEPAPEADPVAEIQPSREPLAPDRSLPQSTTPDIEPIEPTTTATPPTTPVYRKEGGGGARHREIELLVKELGEAANFRASVEETILDGEGRVDVILRRDKLVICCEVSVTTTKEHELLNVRKCLQFGASEVWLIAHSQKHQKGLARHVVAALSDSESERVSCISVDGLSEKFAKYQAEEESSEKIIKGYRVRSSPLPKGALRKQIDAAFSDDLG